MTDPNQPSPPAEATPSGSEEPTHRKKLTGEQLRANYPDSYRPPTANPLSTRNLRNPTNLTPVGYVRQRLGLTDHDVRDVPRITPRVKEAVGTVKAAIRILAGDDAPDSIAFMAKWNSLSKSDQKNARLEDVIVAAGLTPRRFMELLAGASMDYSSTVSKLIVSKHQPKVLKATIKAATDELPITDAQGNVIGRSNGDVKAMELFHKITGALPTPKGSNFTLNQQINNSPAEASTKERTPLESMDNFLLEIEAIRKPKQLEARTEPIIPVEMPDNAPEIEYLDLGEVS